MVDIATFIQNQGRLEPLDIMQRVEGLQSARNVNALNRQRLEQANELRGALRGGDVNELSRIDPATATQVFDLQGAQEQQAATRLMTFARSIETSQNPKAMLNTLRNNPEFTSLMESIGIDPSLIGDPSDLSDDEVRQGAVKMRDSLSNFVSGPLGLIGNTALPSDVRSALAFQRGDEDFQEAFLTSKRARQIEDLGGVPVDITGGGPGQPLSTLGAEVDAIRAEEAARTAGGAGGLTLTPGQLAVDQAFAPDFVAWSAAGGFADVEKNVSQISDVQKRLESGENLTGTLIGNQPRALLATTNPEALDALEQVEEVVQRNLRLILGAQFTEKEGVRLIARAYNPRLEEGINAKRLGRLQKALTDAAKAKQAAADYFSKNGTLAGFTGTVPTLATIEAEIGAVDLPTDEPGEESLEDRVKRLRQEVGVLESGD